MWASILKDPIFRAKNRRSTDLRDRFRNAFPGLYEAAGYKPRNNAKKKKGSEGLPVPVVSDSGHDDPKESQAKRPLRRRRASTAPGVVLKVNSSRRATLESTTCSDSEESSGGEGGLNDEANRVSKQQPKVGHDEVTPQPEDPAERGRSTDLPRSPLESSGGAPRNDVSTRSSGSLSLSEVTDSSQARTWSLPDHAAQSHTPNWVPGSSPSPRRVPRTDIFLTSQASPPSDIPRRGGSEGFHTMIGKSAWLPEDWLSANPRLESPHPDSSSSSFIGGPSPAPSSPFSFSPSSHGVMDRYDLFPTNLATHSHDYTSSEVGYGDRDTHSAFSEADMFNSATASYRGFTHHSNYAGDLIFAAGRPQHSPSHLGGGLGIHERDSENALDDSSVRRMGLHSGLPGIDEIPLTAIRLQGRGTTVDADMEEAEIVHSRRTSSPPDDEEMSAIPPDLDFQIPPLSTDILAATPTSLTNPISPIDLHANMHVGSPKSRQPSAEQTHAHHHHLGSSSHSRSFSQPPTEHRTNHEHAHTHAPTHTHSNLFPNTARLQSQFDASQSPGLNEPWRSFDLTDLPFLDLHYYTSNSAHAQTMAFLQDPVVESNDNAARALDLAGGADVGHGNNNNIHSGGIAPAQLHAHTPSHYHSLAQAQLQTSPVTVTPAATIVRSNYHHRGLSAVSPDDLLLKTGDNKRKRVSWDGGIAS